MSFDGTISSKATAVAVRGVQGMPQLSHWQASLGEEQSAAACRAKQYYSSLECIFVLDQAVFLFCCRLCA